MKIRKEYIYQQITDFNKEEQEKLIERYLRYIKLPKNWYLEIENKHKKELKEYGIFNVGNIVKDKYPDFRILVMDMKIDILKYAEKTGHNVDDCLKNAMASPVISHYAHSDSFSIINKKYFAPVQIEEIERMSKIIIDEIEPLINRIEDDITEYHHKLATEYFNNNGFYFLESETIDNVIIL